MIKLAIIASALAVTAGADKPRYQAYVSRPRTLVYESTNTLRAVNRPVRKPDGKNCVVSTVEELGRPVAGPYTNRIVSVSRKRPKAK